MKTKIAQVAIALLMACAVLFTLGCPQPESPDNPIVEPETPVVEPETPEQPADLEDGFEFSGYKWKINNATVVQDGTAIVVTPSKGGIPIQLHDDSLAALYASYPTGFAVTAIVQPTVAGTATDTVFASNGGKNFGVVCNVDTTGFYGSFVNWNGRMQLGTYQNAKGVQFGSLLTDASGKIFKLPATDVLDVPYVIRLENNADVLSSTVNGIVCNKSNTTTLTVPDAAKVARSATAGSYGILAEAGETFKLYAFKVEALTTGKAVIKMQTTESDGYIATLKENATPYVFLNDCAYKTRVGSPAITFTVSATNDAGEAAEFTVVNEKDAVVTASLQDGVITVTPVAVGSSVITVTNSSKTEIVRTITVTVEEAATYVDTDYAKAEAFYPQPAAVDVYEDAHLTMTFDEAPVLGEEGAVEIYDADGVKVDSISVAGLVSNTISDGSKEQLYSLKYFMVQISGNTVEIIPTCNALENGKTYHIGIAEGVITGKINGKDFTGFDPAQKRWSFTVRAAYTPADPANILVGSSSSADYRTVQGAFKAVSQDATIKVEKGTYKEILFYTKAYDIRLEGDTTTEYGKDVIIQGINCNDYNGSSDTRTAFAWKGAADLTLVNITIQNAMDRNTMITGTSSQSEALYFNAASNKLTAYNSSFLGHQDTLLTKGKNWFYKCYIEGDTDFIWGYADVALFEECKLVQLNTSADVHATSGSYIFETRVSTEGSSTVGKGYVLLNCDVEANHPNSNFARRASAKNTTGNYHDQVAIINTDFTGTVNTELWGYNGTSGNEPFYIAKDADSNMNVGWKTYGGSGFTALEKDYCGTITEAVYNAEYAGRAVILNKHYNPNTSTYEVDDTLWDYSAYETEFSATADTTEVTASVTKTVYDFGGVADPNASEGLTASNITWNKSTYAQGAAGASLTAAVTGKCTVTVSYCYAANAVIGIGSQKSKDIATASSSTSSIEEMSYINAEGAGDVVITYNGTTYITKVVIDYDDTISAVEEAVVNSVTVKGLAATSIGESVTLQADVASTYVEDKDVTWISSNEAIATVEDGVVTGVAAGTATITATSVFDTTKSGTLEVTVNATVAEPEAGKSYTWNFVGLSAVPTKQANAEGDNLLVSISGTLTNNSQYGLYNADATYTIPVTGDVTVIAYATYLNTTTTTLSLKTESGTVVGADRTLTKTDALWNSSADHKPANGPVPYVWHYSGEAGNLLLSVPAKVYLGMIVADNTAVTESVTACSYDFTSSTMATPLSPSAGNNKIHWFGSATAAYKDATFGIQAIGPTCFSFYVGGTCIITFTDTYDNGVTSNVTLFSSDNTVKGTQTLTGTVTSATEYSISYAGGADVLRLNVPKNVYISNIAISAVD